MKTLIIPAAGKGKRMSEFYFPKCLLAVGQRPVLFQIIDSWKGFIDEVVIVLNEENGKIIEEYVSKYYLNKEVSIKYCYQKKISGTYFAILEAMKCAQNKEYILNWSDILINPKITDLSLVNVSGKNLVFTTEKKSCRWGMSDSKFVNRGPYIIDEGGIYGVFVINKISSDFLLNNFTETDREVEVLEKLDSKDFIEVKYEEFTDIGDDGKYTFDLRGADEKTRAYGSANEMTVYENIVVKNTHDKKLKRCEAEWYKNSQFDFTPKIFCYDPLIMERIKDSMTLSDRLIKEGKGFEQFTVSNMFKILEKIHTSKDEKEAEEASAYDQYFGKTIKRLEKVDFLFSRFNKSKIEINGKLYANPLEVLKQHEKEIKEIFPKKFRVIHGDLQTSNALITKKNKIYVIDPRGYFGNSELYGDPMYDFAKLYYGFCGMWDKFRKGDNKFKVTENGFEIVPLLDKTSLDRRRELFFECAKEIKYCNISKKDIDLLHAIIWLSVCDYIANDLLSSLYAYLYGTILINEVFEK